MEDINQIKKVSIWIFIVPVVALNLCLLISVNYILLEDTVFSVDQIGRSGFTIPYIDGSLSISRSARTYPSYLVFKPAMIITSILLIKYWLANNRLFSYLEDLHKKKYFMLFGIGSALFLILHSIFLGLAIENDLYKFFRRFILLGFIIFEITAQTLLVINIFKIKTKVKELINNKILILKAILVIVLIIVAIFAAPILNSTEHTHFKHALEWNYFIGVVLFYLLTFLFWKKGKV